MSPGLSFLISILAFAVSAVTAWLTFFRKGLLKMTQPAALAFLPAGPANDGRSQILLRTLLYSTSKRGQIVESLHVAVQRAESKQNFSVWVYGQKTDLRRGSGLFVSQEGVTYDHYFLMPKDGAEYPFLAGDYRVTVFAKHVGAAVATSLMTIHVSVSDAHAASLLHPRSELFFDWGPDRQAYHAHILTRSEQPAPKD